MSESINLGHVKTSADIIINGRLKDIKIGLTSISKRLFTKSIREKNRNNKFKIKNANCHSLPKKTLHKAIKNTGSEKKNRGGL